VKRQQEIEFVQLQKHVEKYNFVIGRTFIWFSSGPSCGGKAIKTEEIQSLTEEQRSKLEGLQAKLTEEVERVLKQLARLERQRRSNCTN